MVEHQDLQEHLVFDENDDPARQHGWQAHPSDHEIWIPVDPNIHMENRFVACYQDRTRRSRRLAKNDITLADGWLVLINPSGAWLMGRSLSSS